MEEKIPQIDLFGNPIVQDELLRDRFIEPPFSVLDTKSGNWQRRKRLWISKGIRSEVGRDAKAFNMSDWLKTKPTNGVQEMNDTSVFDPALCEVLYRWFCTPGGTILDPFAGGSVRGIVANYLGFRYTGIDIRPEQIESNRQQSSAILPADNQPEWLVGDSNDALDGMRDRTFDLVFSCPPYADLEVYSDMPGDISNMPYPQFLSAYRSIIRKSCDLLCRRRGARPERMVHRLCAGYYSGIRGRGTAVLQRGDPTELHRVGSNEGWRQHEEP